MVGCHVIDKVPAIIFPVAAFVAAGFEHCVANIYFIPLGLFLGGSGDLDLNLVRLRQPAPRDPSAPSHDNGWLSAGRMEGWLRC